VQEKMCKQARQMHMLTYTRFLRVCQWFKRSCGLLCMDL